MINEVEIVKLDNQGRGICYIDDKITFVPNALRGEVVKVKLTKESKKFNEGEVVEYISTSKNRLDSPCPYYQECGGCDLLHTSYEDTLRFKKEKLESILSKYGNVNTKIDIEPSKDVLHYRNKITLKVVNGNYGYFKNKSHNLLKVNHCLLASNAIDKFMDSIKYLNIKNGEVIIRSNYNNELLISINSKDKIKVDIDSIKKDNKIVGVVVNNKCIYGEDSFVEIINHQLFKVSYDSFFQINRYMCSKIFDLILEYVNQDDVILDLYCGVGTLGINALSKAKSAYGIEIVKNAILNAITNSRINKRDNIFYMLGDVAKCLPKINEKVNTVIVDPPRAGLDNVTKETLRGFNANRIIYVSCDPMTLARDVKELSDMYYVKFVKGLDMFPFTQHCETFCVLERR